MSIDEPQDTTPPNVPSNLTDASIAAAAAALEPAIPATDRKSIKREQRQELFTTPSFIIGSAIALFWLACAVVPGIFTKWAEGDFVRNSEGASIPRVGPQSDAWFGTDSIGRDVFARVVYGADNVLITSPLAALIAVLAGAVIGLTMGYYRGWIDEVLSRILEAILSLPVVLLGIMAVVTFGSSRLVLILTIASLFTPVVARTVRSAVLAEAQLDYVTSAKLRGEPAMFIMMREIFPNISNILVVEFTVRVGYAIFTVATLSFLGFSVGDATEADWGRDISETYNLIQAGQWWPSIFPALAIASLVIAINLIADSVDKVYSS